MIPSDIALLLLQETADPCAVVERRTQQILWSNTAWKGLDAATQTLRQSGCAGTTLSQRPSLAALVAGEDESPSRQIIEWNMEDQAVIEATAVVHPFELEGEPVAAVMILLPRPALDLPPGTESLHTPDALTGLAGRAAVEERIARLESMPPESASDLAVLFIDLNGFKAINDRWGHATGDQVLAAVASRLANAVRSDDLIARFGGDEFLVLVEGFSRREQLAPLVDRLRKATEEPVEIKQGTGKQGRGKQGTVNVSASIGLALSTEGTESLRDLISEADRRMYADKHSTNRSDQE